MEEKSLEKFALNGFTKKEAQIIIKNFLTKASRDTNGKINETVSVWFDAKKFIAFADELKREKSSGVRIYFANYGNDGIEGPTNIAYKHQNTLVFVSTEEKQKLDLQGQPQLGPNGKPILVHKDYYVKVKSAEENSERAIVTDPENKGTLCPPDSGCDCDEILTKGEPC